MFHGVTANQSACAAQSCLAVYSKHTWVTLTHLQELLNNGIRRCGTINEEHISMGNACLRKLGPLVLSLVQADYVSHSKVSKHLNVVLWRVSSAIHTHLVDRSHEGNKLTGQYPVQVAIFNLLLNAQNFLIKIGYFH